MDLTMPEGGLGLPPRMAVASRSSRSVTTVERHLADRSVFVMY